MLCCCLNALIELQSWWLVALQLKYPTTHRHVSWVSGAFGICIPLGCSLCLCHIWVTGQRIWGPSCLPQGALVLDHPEPPRPWFHCQNAAVFKYLSFQNIYTLCLKSYCWIFCRDIVWKNVNLLPLDGGDMHLVPGWNRTGGINIAVMWHVL